MLEEGRRALSVAGIDSARLDAEILLAAACHISRAMLLADAVRMDSDIIKRFRRMVARRAEREPLAYIIGRKEFFSLDFEVTPAVLIPRPETETLVECALKFVADRGAARTLDIGTGSGAIAVAVAMNALDAHVVATDISEDALAIARRNAIRHRCDNRIEFVRADLFPEGDMRFDVILSNPPYIADAEIAALEPEVREHEPRLATSAGNDGIAFYRRIAAGCPSRLKSDGAVMVEIGAGQARAVKALFRSAGFSNSDAIRDLAGIERVVRARLS